MVCKKYCKLMFLLAIHPYQSQSPYLWFFMFYSYLSLYLPESVGESSNDILSMHFMALNSFARPSISPTITARDGSKGKLILSDRLILDNWMVNCRFPSLKKIILKKGSLSILLPNLPASELEYLDYSIQLVKQISGFILPLSISLLFTTLLISSLLITHIYPFLGLVQLLSFMHL